MESFFSRYKNALVLILVLLAQVIGVAVQVRRPLPKEHAQPDAGGVRLIRYWAITLVSPPERLVHWLGSSILGVWDNYLDLIHVRQQNKDLQAELSRLRIEQGGIAEDARQGQRLQQLLAFQEKYVYKTKPAQIIGTSGTDQSRVLYIDKGAKDGLGVDMPVITPDGIVGRVREVFPHTSQVLEISDPTSGAGVILATTRIRGILRGNAMGQPQMINVMPDERIKAGEPVVTSGGDQIFPRGLPVGYVDRVMVDPERDPFVDILIRPAANLSRLEEVLVITNMGDQVTPRQKLDLIQSEAAANAEQLKASEILAERLPSRIDPDAPKSDDETADNAQGTDAGADGGIARPLRPPAALHPDRFTPNVTPEATSLTPGARAAAQSEGPGNSTASAVKPHAAVQQSGDDATVAVSDSTKKKGPVLVPDDGSRPPDTMIATPVPPATSTAAGAMHSATPSHVPVVTNGGSTAVTKSVTNTEANPSGVTTHPGDTQSANSLAAGATPSVPKTKVIVDGPLPTSAKKTAPAASNPANVQRPSAVTGQQTLNTPAQHAPNVTVQRTPTAPAQHKGPELVPDDGSRPPPTMQPKPAKPQTTQPQQGSPAPQQAQPQGAR